VVEVEQVMLLLEDQEDQVEEVKEETKLQVLVVQLQERLTQDLVVVEL
jgi:hypothetical protein